MTPAELTMSVLMAGASGLAGWALGYTSTTSAKVIRAAMRSTPREIMCKPGETWRQRSGATVYLGWTQGGIVGRNDALTEYCAYTGRWINSAVGRSEDRPMPWDLVERIP